MKAAICYEFGKPLVVEEVEIDPPKTGEVKVKMAACAICHSDVHCVRGAWGGQTPVIAGHEGAGTVSDVGHGVTRFKPGDPVVVSLLRSCGQCFFCTTGRPYNCEEEFALDSETRLRNMAGVSLVQGVYTGAFAEYTVVHQSQLVKIPESLSMDRACLLSCGVITGLGAVTNTVQVETGASVVVVGTGGVGLNSIQGAVLSGAAKIIAVDVRDTKLDAAKHFGATHGVNSGKQDAVQAVLSLTEGRGADYTFVTVGNSTVITQASRMVHNSGVVVVAGMPGNDDVNFSLNAHDMTCGRTLIGSKMGSTRLAVDVPRLVELYQAGRLKLDELITRRYPLEKINEALVSMEQGEALRNVIIF